MTNLDDLIRGTQDSLEIEFKGGRKALFSNPRNIPFRVGDYAVVDIDRGNDIGVVIREGEQVSAKTTDKEVRGPVLRRATSADLTLLAELREKESEAHRICQQCIASQELPMKLVDVEWQFDGNKIRFYFTSDHRVDFRKLVRDLAATFKTRIEMRQIGVRDEARRLGGYGRCGRYYCCRGVIQDFDPVTLKMVKEQHLAPGSPKISGGCGRLMCCLRYERGFYADAGREYPKVGTKIGLAGGGRGRVVSVDIFHRQVTVCDEEGKSVAVGLEDFKEGAISIGGEREASDCETFPEVTVREGGARSRGTSRKRDSAASRAPSREAAAAAGSDATGDSGSDPVEPRGRAGGGSQTREPGGSTEAAVAGDVPEQVEAPREGASKTTGGQRGDGSQRQAAEAGAKGQGGQPGKSEPKKRRGRRSGRSGGSRRRGSRRGKSDRGGKGANAK